MPESRSVKWTRRVKISRKAVFFCEERRGEYTGTRNGITSLVAQPLTAINTQTRISDVRKWRDNVRTDSSIPENLTRHETRPC